MKDRINNDVRANQPKSAHQTRVIYFTFLRQVCLIRPKAQRAPKPFVEVQRVLPWHFTVIVSSLKRGGLEYSPRQTQTDQVERSGATLDSMSVRIQSLVALDRKHDNCRTHLDFHACSCRIRLELLNKHDNCRTTLGSMPVRIQSLAALALVKGHGKVSNNFRVHARLYIELSCSSRKSTTTYMNVVPNKSFVYHKLRRQINPSTILVQRLAKELNASSKRIGDSRPCTLHHSAQLKSNPAPLLTAYSSLSLSVFSLLYIGNFRRFTHVLAVGMRPSSLLLSLIENLGFRLLKPSSGPRGVLVTNLRTLRLSASGSDSITFQKWRTLGCSRPSSPIT